MGVLPLVMRAYVLADPTPLNPDEAQWTVSARRILDDPIVWRSNDLTTSGPLNALVISWPTLFGHVPSLFTSRLTGLVLQATTFLAAGTLLRPRDLLSPGAAALALSATFVALNADADFLHYSSETLSALLIVAFCVVFAGVEPNSSPWRWFLCGLLTAALPFAKLQSSPFAALFAIVAAARLANDLRQGVQRSSAAVAFVVGLAAPFLWLVAPTFLVGEQEAVLSGYFGLGAAYGGTRSLALFFRIGALLLLWAGLYASVLWRLRRRRAHRRDILALSLGLWPIACLAVWFPGRPFFHYDLYLIVALPLSIVLAQRLLPPSPMAPLALALGCLAPGIVTADILAPAYAKAVAHEHLESAFRPPDASGRPLFAWTGARTGDSLLLWGWEPGLTAYAGLKSADRASHAEYLIRPNPQRAYYRKRLTADLVSHRRPAIVLDTVRPSYFFTNYPGYVPTENELSSFPQLHSWVLANYDLIAGGSNCAAVYLRRDLAAAWRAAEIPLRSTAAALVDGSATEKCGDWWQPAGRGRAELLLDRPETVREFWILSSRGGPARDRGTSSVQVDFVGPQGERSAATVKLFDYPTWTVVAGPKFPVARIQLETLEHVGVGPALSEVKAFRSRMAPAS